MPFAFIAVSQAIATVHIIILLEKINLARLMPFLKRHVTHPLFALISAQYIQSLPLH